MFTSLVSPTAEGLFRRAIIESGSLEPIFPTLAEAEAAGQTFAVAVGCPDQTAACLRAAPVSTLLANQQLVFGSALLGQAATPNLDGYVITHSVEPALSSGQFNHVPVIDGTNHDEMRVYIALYFDLIFGPITPPALPGVANLLFGSNGPAALAEYPLSDYPSPDLDIAAAYTDYLFSCNALDADQAMAKFTTTYAYEFADENAPPPPIGAPPSFSFPYGASHGFELPYLFDYANFSPMFTAGQQELSDKMIAAWTNFAKDGRPGEGWKRLNRSGGGFFESLVPPKPIHEEVSAFSAYHKCSFWQSLPSE
ncbi:MAG: carboxylesterase family protein [Gemmataceae bacterium]